MPREVTSAQDIKEIARRDSPRVLRFRTAFTHSLRTVHRPAASLIRAYDDDVLVGGLVQRVGTVGSPSL